MPSDKQYKRVPLTSTSSEYKEMETLFKKTVNKNVVIKGIERVQNQFMWEKYQRYLNLTNTVSRLILCNNTILNRSSTSLFYQHQKWRDILETKKCVSHADFGIFPTGKFHDLAKQCQIVDTSYQIENAWSPPLASLKS